MLTVDAMRQIELSDDPMLIRLLSVFVRANYRLPWTRTTIAVDGGDRVPWGRPVIFAMNHTDRFNYLPLYVWLLRHDKPALCTWAKGKYYQHELIKRLLMAANQIPVPSRGYLITADAAEVLGDLPSESLYGLVRAAIDAGCTDVAELRRRAGQAGIGPQVSRLIETPRDMLGLAFDPARISYLDAQYRLFDLMTDEFVALNLQAFRRGCNMLVFPEGTRSPRLSRGRTGLAQMALRLDAPVVPVGCNGSDHAYPGANPLSRGGHISYRFGDPLMPDEELAEFRIDRSFRPFSRQAARQYGPHFEALTRRVMDRINALLDPAYQRDDVGAGGVTGARRFI